MYPNFPLDSTLFYRSIYLRAINSSQKIDGVWCVCWCHRAVQRSLFLSLPQPGVPSHVLYEQNKTKQPHKIITNPYGGNWKIDRIINNEWDEELCGSFSK